MVSYDIRRLQLTQLEMLKDVHKICVENDIKYFIMYGTMLGAIRHKGFIPWDDDIDIAMMSEDYNKFLKICKEKLPEKYFLQNYDTDPDFPRMWSKVRINNTCNMEREYRKLHIHYGIDMDVFELIYLSDNNFKFNVQKIAATIYRLLMFEKAHNAIEPELRRKRDSIIYKIIPKCIKKIILKITKKITYSTCTIKSKRLMDVSALLVISSDIFEENKLFEFEGQEFYGPVKPIEFLKQFYGDYMRLPPEEQRTGHGDRIVDFENSYKKYRL